MSQLGERMNAIAAALQALYPARVVTRQYQDFAQRKDADLLKGIYTLKTDGEKDFTNVPDYVAKDGTQAITLVGQFRHPGTAGAEGTGLQVEELELTMAEEVKAFLESLANHQSLCQIDLVSWVGSGQLDAPFGGILCELEYKP